MHCRPVVEGDSVIGMYAMHTEGYCSCSPLYALQAYGLVESDSVIGIQCIQKAIVAVAFAYIAGLW